MPHYVRQRRWEWRGSLETDMWSYCMMRSVWGGWTLTGSMTSTFLTDWSGATAGQSDSSWYPAALTLRLWERVPSWNRSRSDSRTEKSDWTNSVKVSLWVLVHWWKYLEMCRQTVVGFMEKIFSRIKRMIDVGHFPDYTFKLRRTERAKIIHTQINDSINKLKFW